MVMSGFMYDVFAEFYTHHTSYVIKNNEGK